MTQARLMKRSLALNLRLSEEDIPLMEGAGGAPLEQRTFTQGSFISYQGSEADECYFVVSGIVQVVVYSEGDCLPREMAATSPMLKVISEVSKDEFVGELAILSRDYWRYSSCVAKSPEVVVAVLPKGLVEERLDECPAETAAKIRDAASAKVAGRKSVRQVSRALRRSLAMNLRLSLEDLAEIPLDAPIERRSYQAGELITRQGEDATCALYISSGSVRLLVVPDLEAAAGGTGGVVDETYSEAAMKEVGRVEAGGFVGEIAILTEKPHRLVSAVAVGNVEVVAVSRDELTSMVGRSKSAGTAIVEGAAKKEEARKDTLKVNRYLRRTLAINLRLQLEDLPCLSLDATVARRSYAAGEFISRQGSEAGEAYYVAEGRVSLMVAGAMSATYEEMAQMPASAMKTVGSEQAGGFVGEIAILTGGELRLTSCVATEATTVMVITRRDLEDMIDRSDAGQAVREAALRKVEARKRALAVSKQLRRSLAVKLAVNVMEVAELPWSVAEDLEVVACGVGAWITRQGDEAECAYYVKSGEVQLLLDKEGEEGGLVEMERIQEGGFVGEMAILMGEPKRFTSAQAITRVELYSLPKAKLMHLVETNPTLGDQIRVQANAKFLRGLSLGGPGSRTSSRQNSREFIQPPKGGGSRGGSRELLGPAGEGKGSLLSRGTSREII